MKQHVVRKHNAGKGCFVCGVKNDSGFRARFYELEDGTVAGLTRALPVHLSYPGRVHGGASTALLDEAIGRAIQVGDEDAWGVTAEISTRYKKPVPFGVPLLVLGRITSRNRMMFAGEGCIVLPDGTVAVTAKAKYMRLPLERISDFEGDSYVRYPSPEDPAEIDVPDNW